MIVNYLLGKRNIGFFLDAIFLQEIKFCSGFDPMQLFILTFHPSTLFMMVLLLSGIDVNICFSKGYFFQMLIDFDNVYLKLHCQITSLLFHHIEYNSYNVQKNYNILLCTYQRVFGFDFVILSHNCFTCYNSHRMQEIGLLIQC